MCNKGYENFKAWMLANFDKTELADICNHGAQSGFCGLTYYSETVALYDQFEADIWSALDEDCEALGYKSIPELIATFGGASATMSDHQHKNLLVWYLAEKVAFEITEGEYPSDDECENNAEDDE